MLHKVGMLQEVEMLLEVEKLREVEMVHKIGMLKKGGQQDSYSSGCSVSRGRPHKVDKRMVLEYTHGLFIT
jgi:hypothetical protein